MLLTSEQHAKLAEIYSKPNPRRTPEEEQVALQLARYHAVLSKSALQRKQALEMAQHFLPVPERDKGS